MLLGAEFLAMILVLVYVGAVAVLFLFVVMMLDINFAELRAGLRCATCRSAPLIGVVLLVEMVLVARRLGAQRPAASASARAGAAAGDGRPTPRRSAQVLYTDYVYLFQVAGLVLLVAMIGAIVLTLRHRPGVRRQDIGDQVDRADGRDGIEHASRSTPGRAS